MNKLLICDLPRCLFGQLYLIVDYLFMSNPRAMFEFLLIVYFKPTRNVQAYANLRWDILFINKHFSAHYLLNEWPLQSNRAFRSKPKSRSWWCVKKGSFNCGYSINLFSNSNRWIKTRSTLRCLRSSLRCVFLVSNQFNPVKKASSVMAASVGSTAPAIGAYSRHQNKRFSWFLPNPIVW